MALSCDGTVSVCSNNSGTQKPLEPAGPGTCTRRHNTEQGRVALTLPLSVSVHLPAGVPVPPSVPGRQTVFLPLSQQKLDCFFFSLLSFKGPGATFVNVFMGSILTFNQYKNHESRPILHTGTFNWSVIGSVWFSPGIHAFVEASTPRLPAVSAMSVSSVREVLPREEILNSYDFTLGPVGASEIKVLQKGWDCF